MFLGDEKHYDREAQLRGHCLRVHNFPPYESLSFEAYLKQAIGLVKYQVFDGFQREIADFQQQVHETTGRGDDNVGVLGQRRELLESEKRTVKR